MLPLYENAQPCVGSGYCCQKCPCPFGESIGPANPACRHLQGVSVPDGCTPRYTCGIYHEIIKSPGWELAPAFGAGCCSTLGNVARQRIFRELATADAAGVDIAMLAALHQQS